MIFWRSGSCKARGHPGFNVVIATESLMELEGQNIDHIWAIYSDIYVLAPGLRAHSGAMTMTGIVATNTFHWCTLQGERSFSQSRGII